MTGSRRDAAWAFVQLKPEGWVNLDHIVSVEADFDLEDPETNALVRLSDGRLIYTGTGVAEVLDKITRAVEGG